MSDDVLELLIIFGAIVSMVVCFFGIPAIACVYESRAQYLREKRHLIEAEKGDGVDDSN